MTDEDFGSTTAVIVRKVKKYLTPKVLWTAIVILFSALVGSITWLVKTNANMDQVQIAVTKSEKKVDDMQQKLDILQDMKTSLAVMASKIDNIDAEVTRQRQRWDRVEEVAEAPPHARRRR